MSYRYRDFPGVFQDADPDAVIDVEQPEVIARILATNRVDVIARLFSPESLRGRLDTAPLPRRRREFWRAVVETMLDEVGH